MSNDPLHSPKWHTQAVAVGHSPESRTALVTGRGTKRALITSFMVASRRRDQASGSLTVRAPEP
jgi:hypothetical protein